MLSCFSYPGHNPLSSAEAQRGMARVQAQNVVGPFGFRAFTHFMQQKSNNNNLQTFEEESQSPQLPILGYYL